MTTSDLEDAGAFDWADEEVARYAKRASRGDRAAFGALFGLRVVPVYVSIACLAGPHAPLDALTIRVFDRSWEQLSSLDRPEAFDPWLLDIVSEVAANEPDASFDRSSGIGRIAQALATLVPRHLEIVLLRNLFRTSAASVAQALKVEVEEVHRLERTALELMLDHAQQEDRIAVAA